MAGMTFLIFTSWLVLSFRAVDRAGFRVDDCEHAGLARGAQPSGIDDGGSCDLVDFAGRDVDGGELTLAGLVARRHDGGATTRGERHATGRAHREIARDLGRLA